MVRVTYELPVSLYRRAHTIARAEGLSVQRLASIALRELVAAYDGGGAKATSRERERERESTRTVPAVCDE